MLNVRGEPVASGSPGASKDAGDHRPRRTPRSSRRAERFEKASRHRLLDRTAGGKKDVGGDGSEERHIMELITPSP